MAYRIDLYTGRKSPVWIQQILPVSIAIYSTIDHELKQNVLRTPWTGGYILIGSFDPTN